MSVTIKQNWDSSQWLAWITAVVILHNVGVCGQQPMEMQLGDGCFCVCFMMVKSCLMNICFSFEQMIPSKMTLSEKLVSNFKTCNVFVFLNGSC